MHCVVVNVCAQGKVIIGGGMNIAQAYEANFYWRCKCGYENNSFWFYEGGSSYNFTCDGCGEKTKVLPPPENAEGAQTQPTTPQGQNAQSGASAIA
jgi:hypothetical protein